MRVVPTSLISVPSEGEMAQDMRSGTTARPGLLARFQLIEDIRCAVKVRHTPEAILGVMVFGSAAVGGDYWGWKSTDTPADEAPVHRAPRGPRPPLIHQAGPVARFSTFAVTSHP
ncbi:hypothetical protein [Planotetraspora silvatica]|uniref:hypothetical protein n=1 Tax=Planotetraspora silvatica TaxID=234614 RepID=UPI0019520DDC|nr:hypothetical protein [Planotetraspora silvatica]